MYPRSPGNGHLFVLPFSIHLMLREPVAYYSSRSHISRSGDLVCCHFASQVESYFLLIYGLLRRKNRKTFIRLDLRRRGLQSPPARARCRIFFLAHHSKRRPRAGGNCGDVSKTRLLLIQMNGGKKICIACRRGLKISN